MRESTVEAYLVERVEATGGMIRKLRWVGRKGAPDRIVIYDRLLVFVELKTAGGKLAPCQKREIKRLERYHMPVRVIDTIRGVDALVHDCMVATQVLNLVSEAAQGSA